MNTRNQMNDLIMKYGLPLAEWWDESSDPTQSAVTPNRGDGRSVSARRPIMASMVKSVAGLAVDGKGTVAAPMATGLRESCILGDCRRTRTHDTT